MYLNNTKKESFWKLVDYRKVENALSSPDEDFGRKSSAILHDVPAGVQDGNVVIA